MNNHIKDIVEVLPGMSLQMRAEHVSGGSHQVVLPRHLTGGQPYRYNESHRLCIVPRRPPGRYLVRPGDVLFVSRGIHNHAVVVESVPDNTIASGTLYILRAKHQLDPVFLAWCINQTAIQMKITQVRTGAGTPIVQRNHFSELTIPFPDRGRQTQIAELSMLMAKEAHLREKLTAEAENYYRQIGIKLFEGMFRE